MRFRLILLTLINVLSMPAFSTNDTWSVTPNTCIAESKGDTCGITIHVALKRHISGEHCLFLDGQKLKCYVQFPNELHHYLTLESTAILTLLNKAGLSIAEQRIVVQYIKNKRRRTRAPWSVF